MSKYVIKSATFYLAKATGSEFVMRQKQAHRFASRAEAEAHVKAHPYPPNLRTVRLVPKAPAPGQWVALIVGEAHTNLQLCTSEQAAKDQITKWIRAAVASDDFDAEFSQEIHGLFDAGRFQDAIERWEDETPDRVEIHPLNSQGSNDPEPEPLYLIDPVLDPVSLDAFLEANDGLAPSEVEAIQALAVDEEYKGGGGAAAQWTIRRVR